jgi:hypothetical protein
MTAPHNDPTDQELAWGGGTGSSSDIQSGDTVTVVATPEGDNATADSVSERGQGQQGGPGGQGAPPGQEGN